MKPEKLKLRGLNSFIEEQEIDFSLLLKDGFFGIFGPTGSGKSSIIDAITLALYGEMSRFEGEKSNKHFINSHCNEMWVSFEFSIVENNKNIYYTAERSYKRLKDTLRQTMARLYKKDQQDTSILADKPSEINQAIEKILGLNYKDFTRSIVLPQGKFSQFLLLSNKDRRDMLERIFGLEKYGDVITQKIKNEMNEARKNNSLVENKINFYGDISLEEIEEKESALKNIKEELMYKDGALKELQKDHKTLEHLYSISQEYSILETTLEQLNGQSDAMDKLKKMVQNLESCIYIRPLYEELLKTQQQLNENQGQYQESLPELKKAADEENRLKDEMEKFKKDQDSNLKILLEREFQLNQGAALIDENRQLSDALTSLREEYKQIKKDLIERQALFNEYSAEKEVLSAALEKLIKEKEANLVLPDYRSAIENGFRLKNSILDLNKRISPLYEKNQRHQDTIANAKLKITAMAAQIEELTVLYEKENESFATVKKALDQQKDQADILDLKERYLKKQYEFSNLALKKKEYENFYKEKALAEQNVRDHTKILNGLSQKEAGILKELEQLKNHLDNIQKNETASTLAVFLSEGSPCPVCGSLSHPHPAAKIENTEMDKLSQKLNQCTKNLSYIGDEIKKTTDLLSNYSNQRDFLLEKMKDYSEDIISFNAEEEQHLLTLLSETLTKRETFLKEQQNQFTVLEKKQRAYENELTKINFEKKALEEALLKESEYHKQAEEEIQQLLIKKGTLEKELDQLISATQIEDFAGEYDLIANKNKRYIALENQEASKRSSINILDNKIDSIKINIQADTVKIENINVQGSEKKKIYDQQEEKISRLVGTGDLLENMQKVKTRISYYEQTEKELSAQYTKSVTNFQHYTLLTEKLSHSILTYENILHEKENNVAEAIKDAGFCDIEHFLSLLKDLPQLPSLKSQMNEYDLNLLATMQKMADIKDKYGAVSSHETKNQLEEINTAIDLLKNAVLDLSKSSAVLEKNLEGLRKDFMAITKLKKDSVQLLKRMGLLEDLAKLFEGKKFVEYASKRHLFYITQDASKRIKDMTQGRYAIELDNTDFIIRDDFAGGIRRSPKTLSGGETFLVSLCLALGLSAKIQLKSKSSLEFFFLDEGFGSLDRDLLDTVIDSLFNLRNQNIKVGIISHVEELKNRMPQQLIVKPPDYENLGSSVKLWL